MKICKDSCECFVYVLRILYGSKRTIKSKKPIQFCVVLYTVTELLKLYIYILLYFHFKCDKNKIFILVLAATNRRLENKVK